MAPNTALAVFNFISDHFHVLAWPTLFVVIWRGRGYIDKFLAGVQLSDQRLQETHAIATQVKAGVDEMRTNHLAHVQADVEGLAEQQGKTVELLGSIDKNIAILVDRRTV